MGYIHKLSNPDMLAAKQLKEDALDLLEAALSDLSPDDDHKLHLQMGIEREGHFVPPEGKVCDPAEGSHLWSINMRRHVIASMVDGIKSYLIQKNIPFDRIYQDGGTYLIEMTTPPRSPKICVRETERISKAMLDWAKDHNVDACFGTMEAPFAEALVSRKLLKDEAYKNGADEWGLAGRGQHANVSLWYGNENVFATSSYQFNDPCRSLGGAVAMEAMRMLPSMVMPCRAGNYYRIADNVSGSIQFINIDNDQVNSPHALNWRWKAGASATRLEFRQGAPEADPLDVALAAAIPATKACLDTISVNKDTGKAVINAKGELQFDFSRVTQTQPSLMPQSQDVAAATFNKVDNPNFTFLNELAETRYNMLVEHYGKSPSLPQKAELEKAAQFLNIGSRLHHMYCREYGIESVMKLKETSVSPARRA